MVIGLVANGWKECGGSGVFRILRDKEGNCIKVYLKSAEPGKSYINPDCIITRVSTWNQE